jgi:hypothetical protein
MFSHSPSTSSRNGEERMVSTVGTSVPAWAHLRARTVLTPSANPMRSGWRCMCTTSYTAPGPAAFGEGPQLLAEQLGERIAEHALDRQRGIAVPVTDRAQFETSTMVSSAVMSSLTFGAADRELGPR